MSAHLVIRHPSRDDLVASVASRFATLLQELTAERESVHVCLTGGSVGIDILAATPVETIDWSRVHFWWGDERWLPADHADRNATQATDALLTRLELSDGQIHPFPADDGLALEAAADRYAQELSAHAPQSNGMPTFDLTFLGVGPDGHIASLFPGRPSLSATTTVISETESPKPPPERLSLTLPVLNASERVWLAAAGEDKADAIGKALGDAPVNQIPAAGVSGRHETIWHLDEASAGDLAAEQP